LDNDLETVLISAFCDAILSNNSAVKVSNFLGTSKYLFFLFYLINTSLIERIKETRLLSEILF